MHRFERGLYSTAAARFVVFGIGLSRLRAPSEISLVAISAYSSRLTEPVLLNQR